MKKFIRLVLWVMFSIYVGYLAAGLLSTYFDPGSYYLLADTIAYGILPVIYIGVPCSILLYIMSLWLSQRILNPRYIVPSFSLLMFLEGIWINNDISVIRGNFQHLYIADVGVFVFAIGYALIANRLTSKDL
jgi:hypothetical protein